MNKQETLEEAARKWYSNTKLFDKGELNAFIAGAKWQLEQFRWKSVSEETPPSKVELLVKSPEGVIHIATWRPAYNIFACQGKRESSFDWMWKTI
jgi:hypothetical protein